MDDMILVIDENNKDNWKNCKDTSEETCRCESWEEHWKHFAKRYLNRKWPQYCTKDIPHDDNGVHYAEVGAHIHRINSNEKWIAPMCKKCNNNENLCFSLKVGTVLVRAKKNDECGK